jgi:2-polyprenyl-6-methoxyphenol hydroxylase-like FAD-dependent oxidoreductase
MNITSPKIAIIGGGIAGSTAALNLANQGLDITIIEQGPSLVNGPPICHLHAGGNLYREIDTKQCITLLRQSIDTLKLYHACADYRPTVIAIPQRDPGNFDELKPRLIQLQHHYQMLVDQDPSNQVLGDPTQYFKTYSRADVERLAQEDIPKQPKNQDEWLIPVAKTIDLDKLKFPIVMVQEYGLNVFRLAACATLTTNKQDNCQVLTHTAVTKIQHRDNQWQLTLEQGNATFDAQFDYLINASGYKSGMIDDLAGCHSDRLVEFKAAYVTRWPDMIGQWPEVIFYGQRGTPNGMAQLTPYPNGYFQIHGMTKDITLFEDGLVNNDTHSAQPNLPKNLSDKITYYWPEATAKHRTQRSIDFMANFIPVFGNAQVGGKPLFGAQQIPGEDPNLRASDVNFALPCYARSEIVKASSAIDAGNLILSDICKYFQFTPSPKKPLAHLNIGLIENDICNKAQELAIARSYPASLAKRVTG